MASQVSSTASRSKGRTRTTHALPCPTCGDVFSRVDHLSRHMRSHSQERLFVCPACDKGFIRADSLGRHCRGHCFNPDAANPNPGTTNARVTAACQRCSASKLRCDGEQPCARCQGKQVDCVYVKKSRQRARTRNLPAISEDVQPATRRSEEELYAPQSADGLSNMTIIVQQAGMQESVQNMDFHALNALSQAAMQASTPPSTEIECDIRRAPPHSFIQSAGMGSVDARSQHPENPASDNPHRQPHHGSHGQTFELMPSPRSNTIQNFDGTWAPGDNFNTMNFEDANIANVEDDSPGATSFGGMGYDPTLSGFDANNWTTVDWMFLSEPSAPYNSLGHDTHMVMGGQQQIQHPDEIGDGRTGERFALNNVHDSPAMQHHAGNYSRTPGMDNYRSFPQTGMSANEVSRGDRNPVRGPIVTSHTQSEKNTETANLPSNKSRAEVEKQSEQWPTEWNPSKGDNAVLFPDLRGTPEEIFEAENFAHVPRLSQNIYEKIVTCVKDISKEQNLWRPFLESSPPSLEAFNSFVQLYFEYFQPVFPLLHQSSFNTETGPWVLVLAVASIGCRYSRVRDSAKCAVALQELLRRAIQLSIEKDNSICRRLWVAQTMVLNHLGMLYSGDRRLLELALVTKSSLTTICRRNSSMQKSQNSSTIDDGTTGRALGSAWKLWWREESYRRVGFCAWLLDCQLPLYFDMCSAMTTDELQQNLPCKEAIWEASDSETWKLLFLESYRAGLAPTMQTALKDLGSGARAGPAVGVFARLLLIHAIHQSTWVMRRQMLDPLMQSLDANCKSACLTALLAAANSALDALRVPPAEGSRDTRVVLNIRAHVHHVAVLIHAPLKELLAFAGSQAAAPNGVSEAQKYLADWQQQNEGRTARRAVLNASVLFTLIRNQPSRALYEPISLLVATLTIWAYHQLSQPQMRIESTQATVRLDRIQNEAVATSWVDNGANLRGYITDVGNICGIGAGRRLLQLSCKALADMDTWSLSHGFLNVLSRLQNGLAESADHVD